MILGILAGEPSGDRLGAGLMAAVRRRHPDVRFVGIGGELMQAQGLESVADMNRLAINGLKEPILRFPDLVRVLRTLLATYSETKPDAFIGVDFNVFNFLLEGRLKRRGVPTAHYVSPSVYAWRRGRVRRIARSTDLLLTLFPFEPAFYADTAVKAVFVGHPLADEIDFETAGAAARRA
ncbi:MAG: lipid-A-disaccharide synthase, partial [Gammaproteobacteria bacterium]